MINSIGIALSGLQSATSRINESAANIARSGSVGIISNTDNNANTQLTAPINISPIETSNLIEDVVDLKLAELSYKANLKTLEISGELLDELIDTFRDD